MKFMKQGRRSQHRSINESVVDDDCPPVSTGSFDSAHHSISSQVINAMSCHNYVHFKISFLSSPCILIIVIK